MADEKILSITTVYRRTKLAQLAAGEITTVPQIAKIAFGDGGCDASGDPISLDKAESALKHEIARYSLTRKRYPAEDTDDATGDVSETIETSADFIVVLPAAD